MATQTETKLGEHEIELTRLREHVDVLRAEITQLEPFIREVITLRAELATRKDDTAKLKDAETEIALLKHQIAELAKTKDTWGNRVWLIATIALSAFFATTTAILGALLTFTLNAKK